MPCPRTQHRNNVPILRGEKHDISFKILHEAGFDTAGQAVTLTKLCALTITPRPSLYVYHTMICFMPWSQFTKGAFPGSSRAFFYHFLAVPQGTCWDPVRVPSIFLTPRGPRVTFNSNLKVIRAPAINKPRIKLVNCPAGVRWGPCRHPSGTRRQILKKSTQCPRPDPLRYPGGTVWS